MAKDNPTTLQEVVIQMDELIKNSYSSEQNYKELIIFLDDASAIKNQNFIPDKGPYFFELARLLLNFLASVKALTEHTRNLMKKWYENTDIFENYSNEIKERFVGNELSGFVEELRNYTLHYRLPISRKSIMPGVTVEVTTGNFSTENVFVLEKERLLQWKGWTQKGKPYIEKPEDFISIRELTTEYFDMISEFQDLVNMLIIESLQKSHSWSKKWVPVWQSENPEKFGRLANGVCPGCGNSFQVSQNLSSSYIFDQTICEDCDIEWPLDIAIIAVENILPTDELLFDIDDYSENEEIFEIARKTLSKKYDLEIPEDFDNISS